MLVVLNGFITHNLQCSSTLAGVTNDGPPEARANLHRLSISSWTLVNWPSGDQQDALADFNW